MEVFDAEAQNVDRGLSKYFNACLDSKHRADLHVKNPYPSVKRQQGVMRSDARMSSINPRGPESDSAESAAHLQANALGWFEIASLGVAIAISGNFSGWNYGLAAGGWGGMLAAAVLMAVLFIGIAQVVGELAAAFPADGGFDSYVRRGLGPICGAVAGTALFCGLAVGTGLAASFIAAYAQSISGYGGWPVKLVLIVGVALLQGRGARESARATLIAGAIALLVLACFCIAMSPQFEINHLFTAASRGGFTLFPSGMAGIFSCIPFALFFFIGVEQAALAASEARDVERTIPRALMIAISTALIIGFAVLIIATGVAGVPALINTDDPLYAAVSAANSGAAATGAAARLIGIGAIVSLLGTFFSLTYAASRQGHALALAGELPRVLSRTNKRHAPHWALGLVCVIGVGAAAFDPNLVMVVFVFLLNVTYQLTIFAYIALRRRQPHLARPFRAIGGVGTGVISSVLSMAVILSCVQQQPLATLSATLGVGGCVLFVWSVRGRRAAAGKPDRGNVQ
jgi:ethanolamine permease